MDPSSSNINFSFEYAISIIVIIVVCNLLVKTSPNMNTFIVILAGLLVGYCTLYILNTFVPYLNQLINSIYQYYSYQVMNNFTSMGYMHIWPPILAVLIIFIILLYNRQLG
jgi:ABC-type Fe3+-siderophore transport system permease subunit